MMGSDMPFPIGDEEPGRIIAAAGLAPDEVASINGGLAARLFRIDDECDHSQPSNSGRVT